MSKKPDTFETLLAHWATPKALSDDMGIPYVNAQSMKARKSVSVDHWPKLIEVAAKRGVPLTTDDLMQMAIKRREAA